jgi:hypothetical protein
MLFAQAGAQRDNTGRVIWSRVSTLLQNYSGGVVTCCNHCNVSHGTSRGKSNNTESLETMGAATLASVLVEQAKVDSVVRRKLQLLLASGPTPVTPNGFSCQLPVEFRLLGR